MKEQKIEFAAIALATVLPIVAYFLLELPGTAIALLYVFEAMTVLLLYTGLTMFAKPESHLEERERIVPAGPLGFVDRRFGENPRRIVRSIPPVYLKNLRFVLPTTGGMLVLLIGVGGAVTVEGWGLGRARSGGGGNVMDFFAQFSMFEIPAVIIIALFIGFTHFITFYRYYFATGRYQELTAHMALEIQVKYAILYFFMYVLFFLYAVATAVVLTSTLPAVMSQSAAGGVSLVVLVGSFIALKWAFEWSRFRGERHPSLDDDSFTSNFSPTPPPTEGRT
ncbi:hypothetical protein [Halostagnicola bangensis]